MHDIVEIVENRGTVGPFWVTNQVLVAFTREISRHRRPVSRHAPRKEEYPSESRPRAHTCHIQHQRQRN